MTPRILIAGLWHETNTFSEVPTRYEDFVAFQYATGVDMLRYRGTNTEVGGMIAASDALGFEPAFDLFAGAVPSGLIESAAFQRLLDETLAAARKAGPVDGILLAIHGALVAGGEDHAEAAWIDAVRSAVGRDIPAVATFDLHANLSERLLDTVDAAVGYDTYPHVDMADRGKDAARLLMRILATAKRPVRAFHKLPLLTVPQAQGTDDFPARDIYGALAAARSRPGILAGSVAMGFPYSDRDDLGVAVVAYAEDQAAADSVADDIAGLIWERRADFVPCLESPEAAVTLAAGAPGTTILVDVADNVGGGAPGDGTVILAALLAGPPVAAAIVVWDPAAVAEACAIGVGGRFAGAVGGKADRLHGPPVAIEGTVTFGAPLRYQRRSTYMTGQTVDLGSVAVVDCGAVRVMLTERRAMPFDSDHLRAAGIAPEDCAAVVVKSAIAWKAGFADFAARNAFVDTPGICSSNLARFAYTRGGGNLYPLNRNAVWP